MKKKLLLESLQNLFSKFVIFNYFCRELLLGGDKIIDVFVSDAWLKENDWLTWPALPWTAGAVGAFILGYQLNGIRLGLLGGIGALYIAVFGNLGALLFKLSLLF